MAFFRGEEGSVSFDNGTGSVGAVASTTAWTLDTAKDTLECTAHGYIKKVCRIFNFWFWYC